MMNEREIDVTARQELYKDLTLWTDDEHILNNNDIIELYREQHRTPLEIISICEKMARMLLADGIYTFDHISLSQLRDDCMGWCEESLSVRDET